MKEVAAFRLFAVRIAILITLVAGGAAWALFGQVPGQGLIIGGLAGTLVFWFRARSVEKLAISGGRPVNSRLSVWSLFQLAVYAVVLTRAYYLDPEGYTGLIGAVIGLFVIVLAVVILGLTGLDQSPSNEGNE